MNLRHPGPAQKVAKNHLDYVPGPTTLCLGIDLSCMGTPPRMPRAGPEQSFEWRVAGETNTESQIKVTVR
jgi:hypothetical protein